MKLAEHRGLAAALRVAAHDDALPLDPAIVDEGIPAVRGMPAREILKQLQQAILDRIWRRNADLGRAGRAVDLFSAPRRVAIGLRPLADAVVENGALVRVAERDRVQAADRKSVV